MGGEGAALPEKVNFIYMAQSIEGYKIGMSQNVKGRVSNIRSHAPSAELVHVFEADNPRVAEGLLHKRHSAYKVGGEWFNLSSGDVSKFKSITGFRGGKFLIETETV